jgi:hypothetical protein
MKGRSSNDSTTIMKTTKLHAHRAHAGDSDNSARRSAKASLFPMFRSVPMVALVAMRILSAAPTPQPFQQTLVFEPNRGQAQPQTTWTAHAPGYQFQLTGDAAVMSFRERASGVSRILKMRLGFARQHSTRGCPSPFGSIAGSPVYDHIRVELFKWTAHGLQKVAQLPLPSSPAACK